MKIGTLSFEVRGNHLSFKISSSKRAKIIKQIVDSRGPELLVCAGHALANDKEVMAVAEALSASRSNTEIVLEAQETSQRNLSDVMDVEPSCHGMFLLRAGFEPTPLGRQWFGAARELSRHRAAYVANLAQKSVKTSFGNLFAICCGEINLLKGSNEAKKRDCPECVSLEINEAAGAIAMAHIIVNPTHDKMARPALVDTKRKWLSMQAQKPGICISVSNWNSEKQSSNHGRVMRQRKEEAELHAVYVSGKVQSPERSYDQETEFEYREGEIPS